MKYYFKKIENCNMCGSPSKDRKIIGRRLNASQGIFPSQKTGIATTIVKCKNCQLIYSNPQPLPIDIQDHYGLLPEAYWTKEYFESDLDLGDLIPKLKKYITFTSQIKALDIGAGIGKTMIALGKEGFDTYGIEPSVQFYERALQSMKIPSEKISCISIEKAVFDDNSFDFITFGAVLEHLGDPSSAIEKAIKWLKPGGVIQIQVPSSNWLIGKFLNLIYKITFSEFCSNLSPMHTPYHLYEFHLKSFQIHAAKHNYSIIDIEYAVCNTFMPKLFDYILKPIMRKTNTGMEIYVLLRKNIN